MCKQPLEITAQDSMNKFLNVGEMQEVTDLNTLGAFHVHSSIKLLQGPNEAKHTGSTDKGCCTK